jgi:multidrug efflux pump subunit AcrB
MAHGHSDEWRIQNTHNTARFFTETRHVSWTVLVITVIAGVFGYFGMPQRKDPDVPVRMALAICPWPGVATEKVEQLVTRRIEETVAENTRVDRIESTTRVGVSFVYITLQDDFDDPGKEFDDIKLRLDDVRDLPEGAGPISFVKDFGSTAALMLTVASPKVGEVQVSIMASEIKDAIAQARGQSLGEQAKVGVRESIPFIEASTSPAGVGVSDPSPATDGERLTIVTCFPPSLPRESIRRPFSLLVEVATADGILRDPRLIEGPGFIGVDCISSLDDVRLLEYGRTFMHTRLRGSELHPDGWEPVVIRDPGHAEETLARVGGDKYTYRELDDFTELMKRTLQTVPHVSKVERIGLLDERIHLSYSQERLAAYGIQPSTLTDILSARNTAYPGGVVEIGDKNVAIDPSGEFRDEREIGGVIIGASQSGAPLYLRDVVEVSRGYESPPRFLGFYSWRDPDGHWIRSRAVTLAVQMRPGEKIGEFGEAVDEALAALKSRLPDDLVFARTSDQPLQVEESIDLFMTSLYEAIFLVVLAALIGFWEWRSAAVLAISIPLTLAMTFAMMYFLGVDLQQVSIGSLIIALGLLVDDPVVAGDAIKRDLGLGHKPVVAAWLGPTKLATAILFATITNIVAYLPFLMLSGDMGRFMTTLPIVMTCSLVASRIVSMTFIPLLGYYLLRPGKKAPLPMEERRKRGFASRYYRLGRWAIEHRWRAFGASVAFLIVGFLIAGQLKSQYFPKDLAYLFTIDVWLPEDATLTVTGQKALEVEELVREAAAEFGATHSHGGGHSKRGSALADGAANHTSEPEGHTGDVLESITTFVGGGGPRFWNSLSPQPKQTNYAQLVLKVKNKHDTIHLIEPLQAAVATRIAGARVDVKLLETGGGFGNPVGIRISGDDMVTLRAQAERMKGIFRSVPIAERVQDDWGVERFAVGLEIDADRANMAGVTNLDVAASSAVGMNGSQVGTLREGNKQIPIIARLRMEERARLSDIENLYVYSSTGSEKVPLRQISTMSYSMSREKIQRRDQFRTITVSCFPVAGVLASQVMAAAMPQIEAFQRDLPPGFKMEIGGEAEEQAEGFLDLAIVMGISIAAIFIALVLQFKNAVKPLLVFGAIPYGMVGAFGALWLTGTPFGFMAFLGIASLVGVIVSHVIVLFDFIEEAHERGEPLVEALLDAGIVRLRPVLITVGATVLALFPLAAHGGPLWEPLCYAQIGGLFVATFVTLLLVPVLYAIFVMDLKLVRWEPKPVESAEHSHRVD